MVRAGFFCVLCCAISLDISGSARAADGPSFDCRYAKSAAEKLVCADPGLQALDRQLADTFVATSNQGGIDAKALRKDEDHWLTSVRDRCADIDCLKTAYSARNAFLLDKSLQAASPAAYAETRPFPAPAVLFAEARGFIGSACADVFSPESTVFPGFEPVVGFATIIARNAYVVVRAKAGIRFAFLLKETDGDLSTCRIADLVTLPPPAQANAFLQCHLDNPPSSGFGMRLAGHKKVIAYWSIDGEQGRVEREPLGVLAAEDTIRCQEPETGE